MEVSELVCSQSVCMARTPLSTVLRVIRTHRPHSSAWRRAQIARASWCVCFCVLFHELARTTGLKCKGDTLLEAVIGVKKLCCGQQVCVFVITCVRSQPLLVACCLLLLVASRMQNWRGLNLGSSEGWKVGIESVPCWTGGTRYLTQDAQGYARKNMNPNIYYIYM